MLVRITRFFRRKSYRWFRLTDSEFLFYTKASSSQPKATFPFHSIVFLEVLPILKDHTHCIKLQLPQNPVYWVHFNNEKEKIFFVSLLKGAFKSLQSNDGILSNKPSLNPDINTIMRDPTIGSQQVGIGSNQTFNPQQYQQRFPGGSLVSPKKPEEPKVEEGSPESKACLKRGSTNEENISAEAAQEGYILINKLRTYQSSFIKPKLSWLKDSESREGPAFPYLCNMDNSKEGSILGLPGSRKKNQLQRNLTLKEAPSSFPMTPPISVSTKASTSKNVYGKKISFSLDKSPCGSTHFDYSEKDGKILPSHVDVSIVDDAEEIVKPSKPGETDGVHSTRKMKFNGLSKRKLSPVASPDRNFRALKTLAANATKEETRKDYIDHSKLYKSMPLGSSRHAQSVIGPRVSMNGIGIGPALNEEPDEAIDAEMSTEKEEVKEEKEEKEDTTEDEKILFKLFNSRINKRVQDNKEKSHLSLSVIDPKGETSMFVKHIETVNECINVGQKLMWNFEIEEARKCFGLFSDSDLLTELLVVESGMMEIAISGAEKKIKKALDRLQELMNKANNLNFTQREPEKFFNNELHKAEICIYRGALQFFLGSKYQTVKAIAEGWRYYKKLENMIEKKTFSHALSSRSLHRFRFGHGCFNLVFSLIPPGLLKFMRLIGIMNPNREKGLESLEACRKEEDIRSNYASLILALYMIEFDGALEQACNIIKDSLEISGKCPIFHWMASVICWKFTQAKDACFMIKTALWQVRNSIENATYLVYELAWYHFVTMNWNSALPIFQQIICSALPVQFFRNQVSEANSLAKSLKLPISIDFSKFNEELNAVNEERTCIFPHLPHIAVKLAACHFNLGNYELAIKWLLSATVIYRNYSQFKTKQEDDFSKIAIKFLGRCSMKMLAFEIIYFMRYMPKLPDDILLVILEDVEQYQNSLSIDIGQLEAYYVANKKGDPFIVEFYSSTLMRIVMCCLLGDTDVACNIYTDTSKYFCLLPEDFGYMIYHTEYWVGRALISEERREEARIMLRGLLKRKKPEFSMNTRIRKILADNNL